LTDNASTYMRRLSELILSTEATDIEGDTLGFDAAADVAVDLMKSSASRGGKIILVGNGGSAAVASHMHNDICKAAGTRAMVFTEQPLLTALTNDDGYDSAYESMTRLWADPEDLIIAVSSSGSSANILRAVDAVRTAGASVVTMSGFDPSNPLRTSGEINFYIKSSSYGLVETAHAAIGHYLTDALAGLTTVS
jgi:D-sedoheptulose 7-phosphate isomerase